MRQRFIASGALRGGQLEAAAEAGHIYYAIDWFLRSIVLEITRYDLVPCFNKSPSGTFDPPFHEP